LRGHPWAVLNRIDQRAPAALAVELAGHISLKGSTGGPRGTELLGLGVFLAAAFIVPFVAGLVLDAAVHTSPLFLFAGLVVGIVAGGAVVYTRFKRYL